MKRKLVGALAAIALVSAITLPAWAETVVTPATPGDNGFVVQAPDAQWGVGQPYGSGQAFMVLRETGARDDASSNGSVVMRVNRYGGIGTTGGGHFACGLRGPMTDPGVNAGQCVWIQPYNDTVGLVISKSATKDYLWASDGTETLFKLSNAGSAVGRRDVVARDGASTRAIIGNVFGSAGLGLGSTSDTLAYRKAAGVLGIGSAAFFPKVTAAPAAQAGGVVGYAIDNGSGKLVFKVQFPTGDPVVIATEP